MTFIPGTSEESCVIGHLTPVEVESSWLGKTPEKLLYQKCIVGTNTLFSVVLRLGLHLPGWLGTCSVDQVDFKLTDPSAS